jgi:hypothetical protein
MRERSPSHLAFLLMAAAICIAVLAGCGGGGDSSSSNAAQTFTVRADTTMSAGSVTRAAFVARLNEVCRKKWVKILDNFAKYSSWQYPNESRKKRFADSVRESLLAGIDFHIFDNIYRSKAPRGEKVTLEEIIGAMQEGVERGQRLRPVYSLAQLKALFVKFNQRASQYGLDDCLVNEAHLKGLPLSKPTGPPT